jgi:hypothetical protein
MTHRQTKATKMMILVLRSPGSLPGYQSGEAKVSGAPEAIPR